MAKDTKTKAKKPAKPLTAVDYNSKQAGKLWSWSELPSHMADCQKRPALLVQAVRSFQKRQGLAPDGMLGPNTLAAIRAVWSLAPPKTEAPPAKVADDADDTGDD